MEHMASNILYTRNKKNKLGSYLTISHSYLTKIRFTSGQTRLISNLNKKKLLKLSCKTFIVVFSIVIRRKNSLIKH